MEDNLTFVKRVLYNRQTTFRYPTLKVEIKGNRFTLSRTALDLLGLKNGDGVMFVFNRKLKTGYVLKENEVDSFQISQDYVGNARFTSKELASHFHEVFDLLDFNKGVYYFSVKDIASKKNWFELTLKG